VRRIQVDAAKDARNLNKHGISLHRFADMDVDDALVFQAKTVKGEARWLFLGTIVGRVYAAVVTYRDDETRVISLRPASRDERKLYDEAE
jgi:uncharacterized DUF497 family protein